MLTGKEEAKQLPQINIFKYYKQIDKKDKINGSTQ